MPLDDLVNLTISVKSVQLSKPGFGTGLIAAYHTYTGNRIDYYSSPSEMTDAGWPTGHQVYKAALKYFGQNPHPTRLGIGRRSLPFTKTVKVTPVNVTEGFHYTFKVTGSTGVDTVVDYAVPASATQSIVSGALAALLSDFYRTTTVVNATELFTLVAHGFVADDPVVFQNSGGALPAPLVAGTVYYVIASGLTADAFKVSATVGGLALNITTDGTGTNQVAKNVTDVVGAVAAHSGTDAFFTMTATVGKLFDLKELPKIADMTIKDTTVDPGIATDLAAIYLADPLGWYALTLDSASEAEVEAAAAWTETVRKLLLATSSDSEIADAAVTTDLASDMKASAYARTGVQFYSKSLMGHFDVAWAGKLLPEKPGEVTWEYKTLAGVPVDDLTGGQVSAIEAKNAAVYTNVGGANLTQNSHTASGEWLDVTIGIDALYVDIQFGMLEALAVNKKIPFTADGRAIIISVLDRSLKRFTASKQNPNRLLAASPKPTIFAPEIEDVASSDKIARRYPDITFTATLAGAIHKLVITGTLSP